RARNELTSFRYDAVLHLDAPAPPPHGPWLDWEGDGLTPDGLRTMLAAAPPRAIGLRGGPNALLVRAVALLRRPRDGAAGTVTSLRASVANEGGGLAPGDLAELAGSLGYDTETSWSSGSSDGRFDALLKRRGPIASPRGGFEEEALDPRSLAE